MWPSFTTATEALGTPDSARASAASLSFFAGDRGEGSIGRQERKNRGREERTSEELA